MNSGNPDPASDPTIGRGDGDYITFHDRDTSLFICYTSPVNEPACGAFNEGTEGN